MSSSAYARLLPSMLFLAICVGCREEGLPQSDVRTAHRDTVSQAELAAAMQVDPPSVFLDGTALGDSLARIAQAAYWKIEGGSEAEVGDRMLRYAYRRGFDHLVVGEHDFQAIIIFLSPDPAAWRDLSKEMLAAQPASRWALVASEAADSALERRRPQGALAR